MDIIIFVIFGRANNGMPGILIEPLIIYTLLIIEKTVFV